MNIHIKNLYDEAKKYNLEPYEFDKKVLSYEERLDGHAFDMFNRVTEGENKGRIIGLNREIFIEASRDLLNNLSYKHDVFKKYNELDFEDDEDAEND